MKAKISKPVKRQQSKLESPPTVFYLAIAGLALAAVITLCLSLEIQDMPSTAWGFSGLFSLPCALLFGPLWIVFSIACFRKCGKVSQWYDADLIILGLLNILQAPVVAFCPLLYRRMLIAWVIFYGIIFGWIIYRAWRRSRYGKPKSRFWNNVPGWWQKMPRWLVALIVLVAIMIIIIAMISAIDDTASNTGAVRRKWKDAVLSHTTVYEVAEGKLLAEQNAIYLDIQGVDVKVTYHCRDDNICYYIYGTPGISSLGAYIWDKNAPQIKKILQKYAGKLYEWTPRQIKVYDATVINSFIKDVMELPDIRKLYRAFLEESSRTSVTNATAEFGEVFLDVYVDGEKEERIVLFERAKELGF